MERDLECWIRTFAVVAFLRRIEYWRKNSNSEGVRPLNTGSSNLGFT
jgi:hypothetical protein